VTDDDHTAQKPATKRAPAASPVDLSKRDLTVDLVRVVCVLLVVAIHLLEVGVGVSSSGSLTVSRTLEQQSWFNGLSWAGQIMPLFFVVGGFASITAWRSLTARGGDAAHFVRGRILRLSLPALPLFAFYVIVIGLAMSLHVDPALLQAVATGAGSPLWFVAAYVLVQSLVPFMARLHGRAPIATLCVLFVAAVAVDVARYSTHIAPLGLVNLAFVWIFAQQIGFWYADGWFARRAWWQLVLIAAVCYAALAPLTSIGPYSPDMLTNLNPPTVPLMALAVAQACVLQLVKPALAALMRTRGARTLVFVAGTRLMTIYLWHLPIIIALTGVALLVPGATPAPASPAWWWSRPIFYLLTLACIYALSIPLGWFERPRELKSTPRDAVVAIGAVLTFVPAFVVLQWYLNFADAILGAVCLGIVAILLNRRAGSSPESHIATGKMSVE
jgi:surface polysaccharide O-acyltransferase-like enzyme